MGNHQNDLNELEAPGDGNGTHEHIRVWRGCESR